MAELLVNTLSAPFEPERYRDDYREKVLAFMTKLVRALCRLITSATLARLSHAVPVGFRTGASGVACGVP